MELTRSGEIRAEEGTLEQALHEGLMSKDHPVFIPAATYLRNGHRVTVHLMEGYAFVATGLPETSYFALERECPHVKKVLAAPGPGGVPVLSVIGQRDVEDMRAQLRKVVAADIEVGMRVAITQGTYGKLDGLVMDVGEDEAQVLIELRSFKIIRGIPRMFLEPLCEEDDG